MKYALFMMLCMGCANTIDPQNKSAVPAVLISTCITRVSDEDNDVICYQDLCHYGDLSCLHKAK